MPTGPTHLFSVDGELLIPTDLVRGPWDHDLQHGGAVCGALGWATKRALDRTDDSDRFMLSRLTTEILRPVPAVPLLHRSAIDRVGRRSRVISASLWQGETCVAKSSSQWVRRREDDRPTPVDPAVPLRPVAVTDPGAGDIGYPRPGFNCDVFEFRCLLGTTEDPGPGIIWARMVVGLVSGESPDPVHCLATLSDLGNAVGWERSAAGEPMVNPDVTLQLFRYPAGEWVCLESTSRSTGAGVGMMETKLWDGDGEFGRVLSTTMESPLTLTVDLPDAARGADAVGRASSSVAE
ncbi:MAG: thioesterase family protein [Acidimicrobiales bacterium]